MWKIRLLFALLALTASAGAMADKPWPSRPIRIIVPTQSGAQPDVLARLVGAALTNAYGQPVIVDNKPGAQGMLGSGLAKSAKPDGYTFVLMTSSNVCGNPFLRRTMNYDVQKDFEPVDLTGTSPVLIAVSPQLGVATFQQLIAYGRGNLGKLSYSTPGVGSSGHLHGELISKAYGLDMQHIPYSGGASATTAALAGDVSMTIADLSVQPYIDSGKLVAIAITGNKRWPRLPGVPTLPEVGFPTSLLGWMGFMAPAGTSKDVIERFNSGVQKFVNSQNGREELMKIGHIAEFGDARAMATEISMGCPLWGKAIHEANIQPE